MGFLALNQSVTSRTKIISLLSLLLLFDIVVKAQNIDTATVLPGANNVITQKTDTADKATITERKLFIDSTHNMYGDLLNDDPIYNPKAVWWKPAIRVLTSDLFNWAVARYVYKFDWARVSTSD